MMPEMLAVFVNLSLFIGCFIVLYMSAALCYHIVLGVLRVCNVDVSGIESSVEHVLNKFMGD